MSETLQLEQLTESLQQLLGESLFAIYLYGSAVDGGLGPESDLDVLVVVNQALTLHQRQQLAETYLKSKFSQAVIHSATNYNLGSGYGRS
ncbi:nucleotidyltransferase domain-containing protein [Streptomyces sp. NPDC058423]|uniref:nucleotidyltransferase domain-containing protein n=1 Tax=Streptomyces sp. NPDC058423 TaxID=3346490 RepID=UPI003658F23E